MLGIKFKAVNEGKFIFVGITKIDIEDIFKCWILQVQEVKIAIDFKCLMFLGLGSYISVLNIYIYFLFSLLCVSLFWLFLLSHKVGMDIVGAQ